MRKLLLLFILLLIFPVPAKADSRSIYLTSPANRDFNGEFINKEFESSLAPDSDLGKLVFSPIARPRVWIIDAALVEDVESLADKNSLLAKNWIAKLKSTIGFDQIYATAYGNPDVIYLKSLAPTELDFYYRFGEERLTTLLNRGVRSENGSGFSYKRATIGTDVREFFNLSRKEFSALATVVNPRELDSGRAKIAQLFSPQLTEVQRRALLRNFESQQPKLIGKLRIVSGRYKITTSNQKMPITLVNDFDSAAKVDLLFTPLNNRVVFPEYRQITLNPKSRIQVSVPIKTIAAGDVIVIARFENGKDKTIGATGMLELSSTIISPAVTRFTTGAGVLLIIAAIAQSVRRVRKNRKEV